MPTYIPGGTGVTGKVGNKSRLHVLAHEWGAAAPFATDFWFYPHSDIITASAPQLLTALGWLNNGTVSVVAGSGADFLGGAANDDLGTPAHFLMNASGERITSPFIFGSGQARTFIKDQFGWTPNRLIADFYAVWTTASNADTTGGIGFVEAGGAIQTANDHYALITSDGTNFILRSGAAVTTATAAVDTNPHRWRIILDIGTQKASFTKDGVTIGTTATGTIALETDLSPMAFAAATTSSNVLGLGATHIYYD